MLDEIFDGAVSTAESGAVWFGAGGACAGGALAIQQRFSMLPAIGSILAGHYLGHTLYASMYPSKSW